LQWLIEKSDYNLYDPGDHLFYPDKPADHMIIIVQGELVIPYSSKE
jgi:CRP-like cAMP-binding protein